MLRDRPFLSALSVAAVLVALGITAIGSADELARLEWVIPFSYAAQLLGGIVVSFLCLEHHRSTALQVWRRTGLAFATAWGAALTVFAVWPGFLGDQPFNLAQTDAAFWVRHMYLFLFASVFLVPMRLLPPGRVQVQGLIVGSVSALATLAVGVLVVADPTSAQTTLVWRRAADVLLLAAYAALVGYCVKEYLRSPRPVIRYLALALGLVALDQAGHMLFPRPFELGWYATRVAGVMVYVTMVVGLMQEYAMLLRTRRELRRTDLVLRVADAALVCRGEDELLARLREELLAAGYDAGVSATRASWTSEGLVVPVGPAQGQRFLAAKPLSDSSVSLDPPLLEATARVVGLSLARLEAEKQSHDLAARMEEALQREQGYSMRLRALADAGRLIASSLSLDAVEDRLINAVLELFHARSVFIMLKASEDGRLRMHRYRGPEGDGLSGLSVGLGEGVLGRVLEGLEPRWVPGTETEGDPVLQLVARAVGSCSLWLLPLASRGLPLGVLGVCLPSMSEPRSEEDLELLEILAQQVAVAVQNARLFEESVGWGRSLQQHVDALREVQGDLRAAVAAERRRSTQLQVLNQLAVTLNSEADQGLMLDEVLAGALRISGAAGGSLYLTEGRRLRLQAFTTSPELVDGLPAGGVSGIGVKGLAEQAVAERRPVRIVRELDDGSGRFLGFLATPLVAADGTPLACLVLSGAPGDHGFSAEDEMLMGTLAAHTAVALQNLRRLARERDVAEYLQRSMLPRVPRTHGLELEYVYQSASDVTLVGGDFYDVISLKGGRTALVVGDVCGKGLQAATQMASVRYMLRGYVAMDPEPGEWLGLVNAGIEAGLPPAGFVTAALVVVDPARGRLDYALAGHPAPLLASAGAVEELGGAPGLPLGVRSDERYETYEVDFEPEQTLILYSDGLYEARSGSSLYGIDRLGAAARALACAPLEGAAERLVSEARDYAGGRLADDVVVLLVRLTWARTTLGHRLG
ncbi:MAG: SpoIIE family protein phosphatase [Thermoleophilia bacterium]|nr:SpoIIE family protein phosphatase [Thermoleophilia bacterium]